MNTAPTLTHTQIFLAYLVFAIGLMTIFAIGTAALIYAVTQAALLWRLRSAKAEHTPAPRLIDDEGEIGEADEVVIWEKEARRNMAEAPRLPPAPSNYSDLPPAWEHAAFVEALRDQP